MLFPPEEKRNVYGTKMLELEPLFSMLTRIDTSTLHGFYTANYNHCEVNELHPDLEAHPRYATANGTFVLLSAGDTLYIPGGWFHAVRTRPVNGIALAVNQFVVRKQHKKKVELRPAPEEL